MDTPLRLFCNRLRHALCSEGGSVDGCHVPATYTRVTGHNWKEDVVDAGLPSSKTLASLAALLPDVFHLERDGGAGVLFVHPEALPKRCFKQNSTCKWGYSCDWQHDVTRGTYAPARERARPRRRASPARYREQRYYSGEERYHSGEERHYGGGERHYGGEKRYSGRDKRAGGGEWRPRSEAQPRERRYAGEEAHYGERKQASHHRGVHNTRRVEYTRRTPHGVRADYKQRRAPAGGAHSGSHRSRQQDHFVGTPRVLQERGGGGRSHARAPLAPPPSGHRSGKLERFADARGGPRRASVAATEAPPAAPTAADVVATVAAAAEAATGAHTATPARPARGVRRPREAALDGDAQLAALLAELGVEA